jgi:multidrug transporter EmrE-like cation transporter
MLKIILTLYVLATCSALILLKLGSASGAPVALSGSKILFNINWTILVGGALYVTSFLLYAYLIAKFDLGFIIPLTTALVYAIIFFASFLIFKESFTVIKIIAIALIMIGVILLNVK